MSDDPKHTLTTIRDLFLGVRGYLRDGLTGIVAPEQVVLAFKDERADSEDEREYPRVTIELLDFGFAANRRGAHGKIAEIDEEAGTASVSAPPIPVDFRFQIDAYSTKTSDDWTLIEKLLPMFASHFKSVVETPDGVRVFLHGETFDNLSDITGDGLFRKTVRVRTELWMASAEVAAEKFLVLTRRLSMEGELWDMPDVPV